MVKKTLIATSASLAFFISAPYAHAVSITTEKGPNGDRIRITQANDNQNIQSLRVSPDTLFIQVDNQDTPAQTTDTDLSTREFINNIVPSDAGVSIGLGKPGFGFIQSKDQNGDILIDIYPDSLGARWRQSPTAKTAYDRLETINALPSQNINSTTQPQVTAPAIPVTQPQVTTPVTQPQVTAPVTQPQVTTPVTQPQVTTPVTQPQVTAPTTPVTQPQVTTPVTQPQVTAPTTPVTQPQVTAPTTPVTQPQVTAPVTQPQVTAPTTPVTQPQVTAPTQINIQTPAPNTVQQTTTAPNTGGANITINQQPQTTQTNPAPAPTTQDITLNLTTQNQPTNVTPQQQTQAPPKNINLNIINENLSNNVAPQQNQQDQTPPQNINIDIKTDNNQTAPQVQTQTPAQNINIDIKTDSNQATPQAQTQAPAQDININIDATKNTPQENTSTTPKIEGVEDININVDATNNEQEIVEETPPTSFSFSLSDQNSNEAKSVEPRQIIEEQKIEEIKKAKEEALKKTEDNNADPNASEKAKEEAPVEPAPEAEPAADAAPAPVGEIIYVDEAGNIVPAPLDIPQTIKDMRSFIKDSKHEEALKAADLLKEKALPIDLLEEVLYNRMTTLFSLNQDKKKNDYNEVIDAAHESMNMNPSSEKIPEALSALAVSYLALGRTDEANAQVDTLLRNHPNTFEAPASMILLANHLFDKHEYIKASKYLQVLVDEYPNEVFAKEAALLQTKSLHKQGDFKKTMAFIDFMDRRWNRLYLTAPEYFIIRAEVEEDNKLYQEAISTYWLMYNLAPKDELADFALYKIANLYHALNEKDAARDVLTELVDSFPESKYRVSSLLKIGENGIYPPALTLEDIFNLFNEPNPNLPSIYYKKIIEEYPDSQEAMSSKIRLAAQALWEKDYSIAADLALAFHGQYPDAPEAARAYEILLKATHPQMALSLSEKNYEQTLSILEKYPPISLAYTPYSPVLRMALGRALLNRKQEKEGEEMLAPFLDKLPTTQAEFDNGLYTYSITLANALTRQDWNKVLETSTKVEDWTLPKDIGLQRLYSTALAAENIGLSARSLPIWQALAPNEEVPLYQRAYAQYFLSRDAERRQNLREAYQANLDTLAMFEDLKTQQSPYADTERTRESMAALMDITEIAGRYTESLQWLNKYRRFVPPTSQDYAGLQLREARLHKKMGDNLRWRSILEQIRSKEPESVFGKMAASELSTFEMARDLNRFAGSK